MEFQRKVNLVNLFASQASIRLFEQAWLSGDLCCALEGYKRKSEKRGHSQWIARSLFLCCARRLYHNNAGDDGVEGISGDRWFSRRL